MRTGTLWEHDDMATDVAEYWAVFTHMATLLERAAWTFARTMRALPHWYTLREKWTDEAAFCGTVVNLRARGYQHRFGRKVYTYCDVNDHFYWTMGNPIDPPPDGGPYTRLINRKPFHLATDRVIPYDAIAAAYGALADVGEFERLVDGLGVLAGPVLDVGCGTGRLCARVPPADYLGIDPSAKMLAELSRARPGYATIATALGAFAPREGQPRQFSTILALDGTGSYLSDAELSRIPTLLAPGGRAIVTFYAADAPPRVHRDARLVASYRSWQSGMYEPETRPRRVGDLVVVER